jgi:hypothetical protein
VWRIDWFSGEEIAKKVVVNDLYLESLQFARHYEPKAGTDYSWVMEYANSEYKRLEEILNSMESKADQLIKYMGTGSGIVALVFTYSLSTKHWMSTLQILPTLVMFFVSTIFASRARSPERVPSPPHTSDAIRYAHAYQENVARASFAAMIGTASIGLQIAIAEKSRLVRLGFRWFLYGVLWLVLTAVASSVFAGFSSNL